MSSRRKVSQGVVILGIVGSALACERRRAPAPPPPRYALHEWGLIAVDAHEPARARLATEVAGGVILAEAPHGTSVLGLGLQRGYGGKPVIYVHLEPGVDEATFDVRLGVPAASVVERWPSGGAIGRTDVSGWQHVVARRGECASPTPPPTAASVECTSTRDGFCEAAEIPRYYGARASCLEVGDARSELLFYRAEGVPTDPLPLRMISEGGSWRPARASHDAISGPIFFITAENGGREVAIHLLEPEALDRAAPESGAGSRPVDPETAKDLIRLEAVQRGLSESEADAFADAWAPAVFARCRREGPEAAGTLPAAFEQSTTSLVYFAPTSVIDAMIPLSASPAPARVRRAFLVRYVDGRSTIHREDARRISQELAAVPPPTTGLGDLRPLRLTVRPGGSAVIEGALTPDQARRVLLRHVAELTSCARDASRRDPDFAGRIIATWIVAPDGHVLSASADDAALGHPDVARCVEREIRTWSFPAPADGNRATVRFPLNFSVSSDE